MKFYCSLGRGCDAVGKVVASDTRDPQIESQHQQNFSNLICVNCLYGRKDEKKLKRGCEWPIKKNKTDYLLRRASEIYVAFNREILNILFLALK